MVKKILFLLVVISLIILPNGCRIEESTLSLQEYPQIFDGRIDIFTGTDTSYTEILGWNLIRANLYEKTGNDKIWVRDSSFISDKKMLEDNIILVVMPDSIDPFIELLDRAGISAVTSDSPGKNKGILEITRNPWNKKKVLMVVGGSDENGLDAAVRMLEKADFDDVSQLVVNWKGDTPIEFPVDSRTEAIRYAILDPDIQAYISDLLTREWGVSLWADQNTASLEWAVSIGADPREVLDVWTEIYFLPDGTIVFKGEGRV